jgi:dCMP deaminase
MARWTEYFMDLAKRTAEMSYARRLRVGSVIVRDRRIVSAGYNGTPKGEDNNCEVEVLDEHKSITLVTKSNVIHAERNAIEWAKNEGLTMNGCELYVTHSPCRQCAELVAAAGITTVYYQKEYRSTEGIDYLRSVGIKTIRLDGEHK